jgi:hypothetical protein
MKKIIRLTESDLTKIVNKVITESEALPAKLSGSYKSLINAWKGKDGEDAHIDSRTKTFFRNLDQYSDSREREKLFKKCEEKHGKLPNHIRKYFKLIYNLD